MPLGPRGLYRGVAALPSIGLTAAGSCEPLLFLYPRWARSLSTLASTAVDPPASRPVQRKKAIHLKGRSEAALSIDLTQEQAKIAASGQSDYDLPSEGLLSEAPPNATPQNADDVLPEHNTEADGEPMTTEKFLEQGGLLDLVRNIENRIHGQEFWKQHSRRLRKEYQRRRRKESATEIIVTPEELETESVTDPTDWRAILRDLDFRTPDISGVGVYALRILVPQSSLSELLYGLDDNIHNIRKRTGCRFTVFIEDKDPHYKAILLSGTVRSLSRALVDILQVAPETIKDEYVSSDSKSTSTNKLSAGPTSKPQTKIREIQVDAHVRRPMLSSLDQMVRPLKWTKKSFAQYVERLTKMRPTAHMHTVLHKGTETHTNSSLKILGEIFFDDMTKHALSTTALNKALRYVVRNNQMVLAHKLFIQTKKRNVRPNTETFNIMLHSAAKSNDLDTFRFLLNMMIGISVMPDAMTWIAFIKTVENPEIKQHILDRMQGKSFFSDFLVQQQLALEFLDQPLLEVLSKGESINVFLDSMFQRFSEQWLYIYTSHRILYHLSNHGLISMCWDFLQIMHSRGLHPNSACWYAILHPCIRFKNIEGTMELLSHAKMLWPKAEFDADVFEVLMQIAQDSKLFNVTFVIWRYACLEAKTTFRMRKMVKALSKLSIKKGASVTDNCWTSINSIATDMPRETDPLKELESKSRRIYNQMKQFERWAPTQPLLECLERAFAADKEHQLRCESGQYSGEELRELLETTACVIPLERRFDIELGKDNLLHTTW